MRRMTCVLTMLALISVTAATASAAPFFFSTGAPDGRMAAASRPESHKKIEIEAADDFVLSAHTVLHQATFNGLLNQGGQGEIREVRVEIYRVFPLDSDTSRTIHVPTRANSPSDVALTDRSNTDGTLRFTAKVVDHHVTIANSVIDGIHPSPSQHTGGDGPVAGQAVEFHVVFTDPIDLPAGHYFFVPQVKLRGVGGNFLWLSAPHPQFTGDLQMWIRNADLDPDWLRVGTDIVGGTTFNGSFSLTGETVP
jgi:hypothetical protein